MLLRKRRSRFTIMAEVLNIASEGTLKTRIMYRANLSFAQLNDYLSFLQKVKLLKVNTKDGRTIYKTTSRGIKYLGNFSRIRDLLKKTGKHKSRSNSPDSANAKL